MNGVEWLIAVIAVMWCSLLFFFGILFYIAKTFEDGED